MIEAKYYRFLEIKHDMILECFEKYLSNDERFYKLKYDKIVAKALGVRMNKDELEEIAFMRLDRDYFTIIDADQVGIVKNHSWSRDFKLKDEFYLDDINNGNMCKRGYIISGQTRLHEFVKGKIKGNVIHHIENTFDNRRSKLMFMKSGKHSSYHNSDGRWNWWERGTLCVENDTRLQELINFLQYVV